MKILKNGMRAWITIASVFSFLGGWILLAHANKPAPLQFTQPAITSPASTGSSIQSFNNSSQSSGFQFFNQSQPSFSRRMLRTGGS